MTPPPKPMTQRERIARLIRTTRLRSAEKSMVNKIKLFLSPFSPADDHDLALADLVIKDLEAKGPNGDAGHFPSEP